MRLRRGITRALAVLALACALVLPARADIPRPSSVEETLQLMLDHVQQTYPEVEVSIDHASRALAIRTPDRSDPSLTFADNLFKSLRQSDDGQERQEILAEFLAFFVRDQETDTDTGLTDLRPVLRHMASYTALDVVPFHRPFLGDMGLFFVWDRPNSVQFVTPDDLKDHGLSGLALEQRALDNFLSGAPELTIEGEDVFFLLADGFYESSFLLDTDLWRGIEAQLGPVYIAAPNRDIVFFLPARDLTAKPFMRGLISDFQNENGYVLSSDLLLFRDGALQIVR